ncbi:MerR family transcriptional regulator [Streptacidiphilus pinicola]|uniref:MerR family transcriptional regulator n=1 Tax=Streptacidiphilus pinicola TaxID=2219663 RepID=A0A2X0IG18_9ACTN|nr:MerR family transcriptional regulator [Streptacidiphilus pinicola]RAG83457.1 MerR family transcriptional regulator [Streptacidiphilus pinicola]
MLPDDLLSIGELAGRAGVSVKAVRFYSDQGLLHEADRSGGGHRRYAPEALERLRLIRSLRALDVPLPQIARVVAEEAGGDGLGDVVARQLDSLGAELAALRWREAALRLLHEAAPGERAELLRLVGALGTPPRTDTMVRYWRRLLPLRLPARLVAAIVEAAVPPLPEQPAPAQVLAFARLHELTGVANDACLVDHRPSPPKPDLLYDGLREAYDLAAPALLAGRGPAAGEALDCFVAAHARAHDRRDTPDFRRELGRDLSAGDHPAMQRYWALAGELTPVPTLGTVNSWLSDALTAQLAGS